MTETYRLIDGPRAGEVTSELPEGYVSTGIGSSLAGPGGVIPITARLASKWDAFEELSIVYVAASKRLDDVMKARGAVDGENLAVAADDELTQARAAFQEAKARLDSYMDRVLGQR